MMIIAQEKTMGEADVTNETYAAVTAMMAEGMMSGMRMGIIGVHHMIDGRIDVMKTIAAKVTAEEAETDMKIETDVVEKGRTILTKDPKGGEMIRASEIEKEETDEEETGEEKEKRRQAKIIAMEEKNGEAETDMKNETGVMENARGTGTRATARKKSEKTPSVSRMTDVGRTDKEETSVEKEKRRQAMIIAMEVKTGEIETDMKTETGVVQNATTTSVKPEKRKQPKIIAMEVKKGEIATDMKTETGVVQNARTTSVKPEKRRQPKIIAMEVKEGEIETDMKTATGVVENARTTSVKREKRRQPKRATDMAENSRMTATIAI